MWQLVKAMVWGGGGALLSALLGAVTIKILAVVVGPTGIGIYSLLRSTAQWLTLLATLNGQVPLVRGLASQQGAGRGRLVRVVAGLFLAGGAVVGLICLLTAPLLASLIFKTSDPQIVAALRLTSVTVLAGATSIFLIAVINGARDMGALAKCQVIGAVCTAALAYPLAILNHPLGYVCLGMAGFAGTSLAALTVIRRRRWLDGIFEPAPAVSRPPILRSYFGAALVTTVTGLCGAGLVLALRVIFLSRGGLESAGWFDAAWTLSTMGLALLTSSFGSYYFPTLSAARNNREICDSISMMFRTATLVSIPLLSFTILFKNAIIEVIYSSEFEESLKLLRWLLIADYIKIVTFVLGMPMLAFARNRMFLLCELTWQASILVAVVLTPWGGLQIVGIAVLCANIAYFGAQIWFVRREYGWPPSWIEIAPWIVGLLTIIALSGATWDARYNLSLTAFVWLAVMVATVFLMTKRTERQMIVKKLRSLSGRTI